MISCRRYVSLLTEAREGTLSPYERMAFGLHRKVCSRCRCYTEGFDQTVELLRELPPDPPPDAMRAELLARLRAKKVE